MKTSKLVVLLSLAILCAQSACHASSSAAGFSESQVDGITSRVVDNLWSRTDYWWHCGDYTRIVADDRIITEAEPGFLEPYATGGWLLESMGDVKDAEKYYRLGAVRNPTKSYIWFNLGFFYYNTMKDYPKAIASFTTSSNDPDADINDWKMLAHSYERNHQVDKAVNIWQMLHAQYVADGVVVRNLTKDESLLADKQITTDRP